MHKSNQLKNTAALVRSMRPYAGEMLLTIASAFLKQMSMLGAAALTSYMVGLAMQGGLSERFGTLFPLLLLCILLRAGLYYGEMWFGHDVAFRVLRDFRQTYCDSTVRCFWGGVWLIRGLWKPCSICISASRTFQASRRFRQYKQHREQGSLRRHRSECFVGQPVRNIGPR